MAAQNSKSKGLLGVTWLVVIIAFALSVFLYGRPSLNPSSTALLTSYSAADASAYRYEAQAKAYQSLTNYSAADAATYRYQALLGPVQERQALQAREAFRTNWRIANGLPVDLTSYTAAEASTYRYQALGAAAQEQQARLDRETFRANWRTANGLPTDLIAYTAADASAYRYQAMAKSYQSLTTFSAADASAYRWEAQGKAYQALASRLPANLTAYNAADAATYRYQAYAAAAQEQQNRQARAAFRANWNAAHSAVAGASTSLSIPATGASSAIDADLIRAASWLSAHPSR